MTERDSATAFAAFREAVFGDHGLQRSLRVSLDCDAYVAEVVAAGAARGFAFDEAAVRAALHEGALAWTMQGADIA